jgi:hypothetical protein
MKDTIVKILTDERDSARRELADQIMMRHDGEKDYEDRVRALEAGQCKHHIALTMQHPCQACGRSWKAHSASETFVELCKHGKGEDCTECAQIRAGRVAWDCACNEAACPYCANRSALNRGGVK